MDWDQEQASYNEDGEIFSEEEKEAAYEEAREVYEEEFNLASAAWASEGGLPEWF